MYGKLGKGARMTKTRGWIRELDLFRLDDRGGISISA